MTTYYVGPGGDNAYTGTSWALRKLTLNGAEDIPVAAGDTVYVGPGTYRETLTCDVSGSAGSPITYIGDYSGAHTDGAGGVVRITGSNNDISAVRAATITATNKNYRTFRGFLLDMADVFITDCTDVIIEQCALVYGVTGGSGCILVSGASQARTTIRSCYLDYSANQQRMISFTHTATVDNAAHVVENCVMRGHGHNNAAAISVVRVGGVIVRNCDIANTRFGVSLATALAAGQTLTVNNCIIESCDLALWAVAADGSFVENYNSIYNATTARTNVSTGANSVAYPAMRDTRWFFEAVGGGDMLTPFDLASYSQLLNLAGTSPSTTDMRGTSVVGAQREWGALEYDPALLIEAGSGGGAVSISPWRGNF